ncbi:MAG: hypothetical protein AAGG01_02505 [Planctomycetota bacterium]
MGAHDTTATRLAPRFIAGGLAGALTLAALTAAAGPLRAELITHTDALPYRTDKRGRRDTPFEEKLANEAPEVVVMGSSVVACAFEEEAFEEIVGLEASNLTVAGSMSAIWYLVIKNRIAKAVPPPKYCVLGFRDTYLTVPEYRVEGGYKQIVDRYVDGHEPLLDRLAYLSEVGSIEYFARRHWTLAQRKDEIVESTERLFKEQLSGGLLGRTPESMRDAVDVIFGPKAKLPSKLTKKQRRAEKLSKANYFDFAEEVEESFLPEMIRICEESGVQLVLVRMRPARNAQYPEDRSQWPDALRVELPRYQRALDAYLNDRGVSLIDFSEDPRIPFEWFENGDHLNRGEARQGFTALLGEAFLRVVEPSR